MTATLVEKTCTPCRGGVPPLTREEADSLRAQAPDWALPDDAATPELPDRSRKRKSPAPCIRRECFASDRAPGTLKIIFDSA
jgi:hypothetical protein